jgi:Spy/CpxP family protein refolding chaperone
MIGGFENAKRGASGGMRRWGLGAVLALALAFTAGGVRAQPGEPGPGPGGPGGPGGGGGMAFNPRLLRELHLSADQEKKLKEGRLAAQKKKIQLHGEKAVLELDLKNILSTYPVNKAEALKLVDKIAEVDKKMLALRVESMVQMLSGLTSEQHAKLMGLQEEWQEKRKAWMDEFRKDRQDGKDGYRHRGGPDDKPGDD